jgi:hypothetical protein
MDEGARILRIIIWNASKEKKGKILRHGTPGFTSHQKEGLLRIFIALRNPSPRPGLNPRPLGPGGSTLTTTPPRRPGLCYFKRSAWTPTRLPWLNMPSPTLLYSVYYPKSNESTILWLHRTWRLLCSYMLAGCDTFQWQSRRAAIFLRSSNHGSSVASLRVRENS